MTESAARVLIVEDELDVAESYELMLGETYETRVSTDPEAALAMVEDVDVVLLDRMMPGMSGDEFLEAVRERGIDVRVAMVTAVDPDFDVVEMGFDAYVQKPPTAERLHETIRELLERETYESDVQEYHSMLARKGALEAEKTATELAASDQYRSLEARIESQRQRLHRDESRFLDDAAFVGTIRDLTDDEFGGGPA